jgi:cyclopropane fatty-acyl-phospholipid synthase-like methyltransferase
MVGVLVLRRDQTLDGQGIQRVYELMNQGSVMLSHDLPYKESKQKQAKKTTKAKSNKKIFPLVSIVPAQIFICLLQIS